MVEEELRAQCGCLPNTALASLDESRPPFSATSASFHDNCPGQVKKRHIAKAVNKGGMSCGFGAGTSEVFAQVHQVYLELLTRLMRQLR